MWSYNNCLNSSKLTEFLAWTGREFYKRDALILYEFEYDKVLCSGISSALVFCDRVVYWPDPER